MQKKVTKELSKKFMELEKLLKKHDYKSLSFLNSMKCNSLKADKFNSLKQTVNNFKPNIPKQPKKQDKIMTPYNKK